MCAVCRWGAGNAELAGGGENGCRIGCFQFLYFRVTVHCRIGLGII